MALQGRQSVVRRLSIIIAFAVIVRAPLAIITFSSSSCIAISMSSTVIALVVVDDHCEMALPVAVPESRAVPEPARARVAEELARA